MTEKNRVHPGTPAEPPPPQVDEHQKAAIEAHRIASDTIAQVVAAKQGESGEESSCSTQLS